MAQRGDDHAGGVEQDGAGHEVKRGNGQRRLAVGEGHQWQAIVPRIAKCGCQEDGHQDRALKSHQPSKGESQQAGHQANGDGKAHGAKDFARAELGVQKQIEDQHWAENIKNHAAEAARFNREGLANEETRSAQEQDRQQVVGKGGKKSVEIHGVSPR